MPALRYVAPLVLCCAGVACTASSRDVEVGTGIDDAGDTGGTGQAGGTMPGGDSGTTGDAGDGGESGDPAAPCVDDDRPRPDRSDFLFGSEGTQSLQHREILHFRAAADAQVEYTRVNLVGNPDNVTTILFSAHGDSPNDRSGTGSAEDFRAELAESTPAAEGTLIVYPLSAAGGWPGFHGGKNGQVLFEMFQALKQFSGNNCDVRFEQFAHSGGGRLNHALMNYINAQYAENEEVRAFVDNNLRGIHDGESIGYSRRSNTRSYMDTLTRFTHVRASFIAGPVDGKMDYVYPDSHLRIAKVFGGELHNHKRLSLEDGRIRFTPVVNHDGAWWDGQYKGYRGGRQTVPWLEETPSLAYNGLGGSGRVAIIYSDPAVGSEDAKAAARVQTDEVLEAAGVSEVLVVHGNDDAGRAAANDVIGQMLQNFRSIDGVGGMDILVISHPNAVVPGEQFFADRAAQPGMPEARIFSYVTDAGTPLPGLTELLSALRIDVGGPWLGFAETGSIAQDEEIRFVTSRLRPGTYVLELTGSDDVDLYVRVGSRPTVDEYDCRPSSADSPEVCRVELTSITNIHAMVRGVVSSSNWGISGSEE